MKIAFVVHDYHRAGGHSKYVVELAERFGRDHEVHVFANTFSTDENTAVRFHHLPAWRLTALTTILTFLPATRSIGQGFDIIHTQGLSSLQANVITSHICTRAWFNARKRTEKELPLKDYIFEATISPLEKQFYSKLSRRVIAVSHKVRNDLATFYGRSINVDVIHHGIDLNRFSPANRPVWRAAMRSHFGFRDSDFVFLFIGDLRKGAAVAIEALARLPEGKLLLVSHTAPGLYAQIAGQAGVHDRVLFSPALTSIERVYAACDAFVFPTPYDAFGMVIAEAMASELTVITTREAGAAEWIVPEVNGILVENPTDATELAGHMLRLNQSPESCHIFAAAARSAVEPHGWDSVAHETMRIYETVLSSGKGD
jgi:UDP-glucose:(heptosyl)LPS alpha-1,3-glucosyltransferase